MSKQLDNNKADWAAITARASLGAIPVAGSFGRNCRNFNS